MVFLSCADDGSRLNADLVALWFFRGSRPVLLRNPIILWFFRGEGVWTPCPPPPPLRIHTWKCCGGCKVYCSAALTFWQTSLEWIKFLHNDVTSGKYVSIWIHCYIVLPDAASFVSQTYSVNVLIFWTPWVKAFRIIPEFRILRLTFHRKSASKSWIRQILMASLIKFQFILRQLTIKACSCCYL